MKLDFSKFVANLDGSPSPITLREVAMEALLSNSADVNRGTSAAVKIARVDLALEIKAAEGPLELDVERVSEIKALINATQGAIMVKMTFQLLEGGALVVPDAKL